MATVNPTLTDLTGENSVKMFVWTPLTTTNANGAPAEWVSYADRCIHFTGTFGVGGTVKLQGSNDGVDWQDLTDRQGTAISRTAASIKQVTEGTRYVRPFVSAGDGTTAITASLVMRRATPMRT